MTWLWEKDEFVAAMDGRPLGDLPDGISGISIDTRSIKPGEAFFAIKGDRFDGHDFVSSAIANQAGVLVVSEAKLPALGRTTVPMVVVDDVLDALGRLGMAARARTKARVIAVTGSAGKTSTKEMLRHMLSPFSDVHASVASFNNHWGVPLTLARMPASTEYGIFEIGMNHPNEIRPLVKMVRPHVAVITTIAAAHLGHFKSLNEIAAAKAEIFEGLTNDGVALINRDNEKYAVLKKLAEKADVGRLMSFGEHNQADFRVVDLEAAEASSNFGLMIGEQRIPVTLGVAGTHMVLNAAAALGAAALAGADARESADMLATVAAGKGRGERHRLRRDDGSFLLIDESYNANPASMKAAIGVLASAAVDDGGRRIAVLGDMRELGKFSEKMHGELAPALTDAGIDIVYLAGSEMKALADALPDDFSVEHRDSADALAPLIVDAVRPGDAVMIKSSLGTGTGAIVRALLDAYAAETGASSG